MTTGGRVAVVVPLLGRRVLVGLTVVRVDRVAGVVGTGGTTTEVLGLPDGTTDGTTGVLGLPDGTTGGADGVTMGVVLTEVVLTGVVWTGGGAAGVVVLTGTGWV